MSKREIVRKVCDYFQALAFFGIMFFGMIVAGADTQETAAGLEYQFNVGLTGFLIMVAVMVVAGATKMIIGGNEDD